MKKTSEIAYIGIPANKYGILIKALVNVLRGLGKGVVFVFRMQISLGITKGLHSFN